MNFSRQAKNNFLVLANTLFFSSKLLKQVALNIELSSSEWWWAVLVPFVILIHFLPTKNSSLITLRDAALFLATGGVIGITAGTLLSGGQAILLEWVSLAVGVGAAILHYSPSRNDKYLA